MTDKLMTPKEFARFLYLENHGPNKSLSYHCEAGTADLFLEPLITQYTAAIRQAAYKECAEIIEAKPFYQSMAARHLRHLSENLKSQPTEE